MAYATTPLQWFTVVKCRFIFIDKGSEELEGTRLSQAAALSGQWLQRARKDYSGLVTVIIAVTQFLIYQYCSRKSLLLL